ncbi:unnamed protein product [Blepharisma stoltei]|uniref:folate gamma-glutamyl hydrolase n=1 Tax=Blepharisma stoltei TaxID=1481888 RepID=A0AAU9IP46_9CILI|nr:unnamed protein product [Blepharisma stoltei]
MVKNVIILGLLVLALGRNNFRPFPEDDGHHEKIDEEISRRPKTPRPPQGDFRPVIGILSVPIFPYNTWNTTATTYLAASYIKYVEMGGARVVPIRSDSSFAELDFLFPRLNGILFPGGTIYMFDNSTYPVPTLGADFAAKACYLYNKVKQANDNGIYYPLWGTCMGFETIQVCENIEYATLGNFNGEPAYIRSNNFTKLAKDSYIFEALGKHYGDIIRETMSKKETSLLSHIHGIPTSIYTYQNNLTSFYNVLSTMHDKSGNPFIAMIEAKNYPIYGTQFHPEKNIYEWEPTSPQPHDPFSVMVSTYFSNFFVSEARRNNNTFVSEQELEPYLIYNYSPLYTNNYFTQTYEF